MAQKKDNVAADFPLMEVLAFVDAVTLVLGGTNLERISEGDELDVLGIGKANIPKLNVPLVVTKASVDATANAGVYILAKARKEEVLVPGPLSGLMSRQLAESMRTLQRPNLTKDDLQFLANP